MTQLQEIYHPNDVQSIAEVRYKLGKYSILSLATLEHAYAHTKGSIKDDEMIGTVFAKEQEKYYPTLILVAEYQGANLMLSNLDRREIWCQHGGHKGISTFVVDKVHMIR